jgi:hypothetical protein
MQVDHKHRDNLRLPLTFSLLGLLTGIAIVLKDVGFVCSLSGAMFGTTLIFIIPQLMVNSLMKKKAKVGLSRFLKLSVVFLLCSF